MKTDELGDALLVPLWEYWDRNRGNMPFMLRAQLHPSDLPRHLLPNIMVVQYVSKTGDFRYRLVGTEIVSQIGRDFTGETVAAYRVRHESDKVAVGYRDVITEQTPHIYHGDLSSVGRQHIGYERLALPMSTDGQTVDQILVGIRFKPIQSGASNLPINGITKYMIP